MDYFTEWLSKVCWTQDTDGTGYHNTAGDSGGPTSWGVTFKYFAPWYRQNYGKALTLSQFATMSQDDFKPYIRAEYWDAIDGDSLGAMAIAIVDFDYGSSVKVSAVHLQKMLGVTADGEVGPVTVAALLAQDQSDFNDKWLAMSLAFYKSLSSFWEFGHGWDNRAQLRHDVVASLLNQTVPASV